MSSRRKGCPVVLTCTPFPFHSYGFMYAAPIFAMNFMIYYVTLFSHGCQILFLIFVEEPREFLCELFCCWRGGRTTVVLPPCLNELSWLHVLIVTDIDKIYGNPDMAEDPNRVYILFNSVWRHPCCSPVGVFSFWL